MNFIAAIAHFCETHGPTSILCTQAQAPQCSSCYPDGSSPQPVSPGYATPPHSAHGPTAKSFPRTGAASYMGAYANDQTPPPSPRSPVASIAIPSSGSSDSCRNCSISYPKAIDDKLSSESITSGTTTASSKSRPLRSKETMYINPTYDADSDNLSSLSTSPRVELSGSVSDDGSNTSMSSAGSHSHTVSYVSTRVPDSPSRYSMLRSSCVRALTCETAPAQSTPMLFGDPMAGYTITLAFYLTDPKARGCRRRYALLCTSPDQKALVRSWDYIVSSFERLIQMIKSAAQKKAASEEASVGSCGGGSIGARGPEGFLRRRGGVGEGNAARTLAELVGRESLFVEVHGYFVQLLSSLIKMQGGSCAEGMKTPMIESPMGGRSRIGSVGSGDGVVSEEELCRGVARLGIQKRVAVGF